MKDTGVTKDVGRSRARNHDGGPGIGAVNRVYGTFAKPSYGERRKRKKNGDGDPSSDPAYALRQRRMLILWSMVFGVVGLVVLGLGSVLWIKSFSDSREAGASGSGLVALVEEPGIAAPGEVESVALAKTALAVSRPEEVSKFIHSESETPEGVVAYLEKVKREEGEISNFRWLPRPDTRREDISAVLAIFKKDGLSRDRVVLLVPDEEGNWKMDFAAFARSTTPGWSEFLEGNATSAVVRVTVAQDQYFNGPFSEQEGWVCFGMGSADAPDLYYGYCPGDSAQARVLKNLLTDKATARVTLGLEKHEGAASRQFRIKRVLAEDWAIRENAADEDLK